MEISLREWLVIGGVVIIALIIFDGWRRVRGGRSSLRMDIDRRFRDADSDPAEGSHNPELPYGGARRAGAPDEPDEPVAAPAAAVREPAARAARERIEPTFGDTSEPAEPARPAAPEYQAPSRRAEAVPERAEAESFEPFVDDDLDDDLGRPRAVAARPASGPAPAATDAPVERAAPKPPEAPAAPARPLSEADPLFDELPPEEMPEIAATAVPEAPALDLEKPVPMLMQRTRKPREDVSRREAPREETSHMEADVPEASLQQSEIPLEPAPEPEAVPSKPRPVRAARPATQAEAPRQDSLFAEPEPATRPKRRPEEASRHVELADPEHVLVITVVSKEDEGFPGGGLHRILSACDLHFGDMHIFHRHEDGSDSGPVQFSMANAVNPGTFDIDNIDTLYTPGVTFFMSMEEPRDVMNAFECMLATAETLARHLNGDLLDEHHSVLRPQTKEHYRQRIRDFEMHNRSRRSATRA